MSIRRAFSAIVPLLLLLVTGCGRAKPTAGPMSGPFTPTPFSPTVTADVPSSPTATSGSPAAVPFPSTATPVADDAPEEATVTFIDNDGFLITAGDKRVLIDALYDGDPERVLKPVAYAHPPFDDVDLMLVTHHHADHFSPDLVLRYLQNNPHTVLVSTQSAIDQVLALDDTITDRVVPIQLEPGESEKMVVNGIDLEALYLSHGVPGLINLGFVITIGQVKFLHPGDLIPGEVSAAYLQSYGLREMGIDVQFVPHFFMTPAEYHPHIWEEVQPRHLIPMHYDYRRPPLELEASFSNAIVFRDTLESWELPAASEATPAAQDATGGSSIPLVLLGTLIDGTGADPLPDAALVIQGDRIVAVGPRAELVIPPGAQVIDLPQATILPGLINTHVHNAYNSRNLQIWAQAGVTTVRDLGQRLGWPYYSARERLRADPLNARLIIAGPLVTVPGGYPIAGNNFPSLTVASPEDARDKVGELIDDGVDVIKITLTSGGAPSLSPEEAAAIVSTAHERGIPVSAHATTAADLRRALDAGVDDIAHMAVDRVPDELIDRMVEAGVSWVPTLEPLDFRGQDNLRRFVEAGGRVALGNDAGYLPGIEVGMPMREIQAMHDAGMTAMQIIVAATRDAAYVCRRADLLGTLEVGKVADILVVGGDPLQNLGALREVQLVIHDGVIIRNDAESR